MIVNPYVLPLISPKFNPIQRKAKQLFAFYIKDESQLKSRKLEFLINKHSLIYILINDLKMKQKDICDMFKCDRTTIYSIIKKVQNLIDVENDLYANKIAEIRSKI